MEMHQIRYFLAVARTKNFTRAADHCNVTQPSLTRAIQKLEKEFGGLLFNRERSLTHLTELGQLVLPHLERTYEAAEVASSLASSLGRAEMAPLVIGVAQGVETVVLDEILAGLAALLPGLTIDLRTGTSDELIEAALKGGMDLLLIAPTDPVPDRLEIWPLFQQSYLLALPNPVTTPLRLADLGCDGWIDSADDGALMWRKRAAAAGIEVMFRHRVDGPAAALRLIAMNLGQAVVPFHLRAKGVALTQIDDCELSLDVVLAAVAGRRRGPAADAFLRAARARNWQT